MIRTLMLTVFVALTACDQATQVVDDAARRSAKVAVNEAINTRFPAIPTQAVTPFTDCVIDNSSAGEIGQFARDAVIGVTDTTAALVRTVIERPETQTCIIQAGRAAFTL
ncbi:hypothetical protein [Tateyamaria sp.]|uniref:hypothetical protein n=1 Tax=Tateyamaria sp. TaxID=1929288 RepID=UPI0032A0FAED